MIFRTLTYRENIANQAHFKAQRDVHGITFREETRRQKQPEQGRTGRSRDSLPQMWLHASLLVTK